MSSRRMLVPIFAVMVGLGLAACRDEGTPTVATAQAPTVGSGPTSVVSPTAKESDYDKALRYTRCMNDHGEKIADPVEGTPLALSGDHGGFQISTPAYQQCKQYLPDTWPVKVDPKELAKEQAFDDCLRKRGVDVPTPDANGMIYYPTDTSAQQTPEFQAAVDACRHLYDDPANNANQ